jgi:hypothetical protein
MYAILLYLQLRTQNDPFIKEIEAKKTALRRMEVTIS